MRQPWQRYCLVHGVSQGFITLFGESRRVSTDALCVVIPARNEELLVARCITSVLAAGVAARHIYVIDDESTDCTWEVLQGFPTINVLRNEQRRGKARSLRRVVTHYRLRERYELMALLDADSHVAPSYFDAVLAAFARAPETVLVCGTPRAERHNWITAYRALEYVLSAVVFRPGQSALGAITVAPGCASTYRTWLIDHLDWEGGTLVEDMDLTVQVHRQRLGRVAFTADAVAFTQDPQTVRGYIGQITRWYSGTWQVMRLHRLPFGRQRIDAEVALLMAEALACSLFTVLLPLLAFLWPATVLTWIVLDQLVVAGAAVYCATVIRRADVLVYWPAFSLFRFINAAILLKTFWLEMVRRRSLDVWFSVDRYGLPRAGGRASRGEVCA